MRKYYRTSLLFALVLLVTLNVAACSRSNHKTVTLPLDRSEESNEVNDRMETEFPEQGQSMRGFYTLDECKEYNGFFIAYDDGSFDAYPTGGYCEGLSSWYTDFDGMYLTNGVVEKLPDVNASTKIAVFSDTDYTLTLHPIHAEVAAFQTVSDDGVEGFGRAGQINSDWNIAYVILNYRNHDSATIDPVYIDGKPASQYDAEYKSWTVRSHQGISQDYTYQIWGFKGDTVTLAVGEGTSLEEKTFALDSKYYDCHIEHNDWQEEDMYDIKGVPTAQGYALADLSNVPNGKYVIVFRCDNHYRASLMNIQN